MTSCAWNPYRAGVSRVTVAEPAAAGTASGPGGAGTAPTVTDSAMTTVASQSAGSTIGLHPMVTRNEVLEVPFAGWVPVTCGLTVAGVGQSEASDVGVERAGAAAVSGV